MSEYVAVAYRYGTPSVVEEETLQDAISFLEYGSDAGEHYHIGVFEPSSNIAHVPPNFTIGEPDNEHRLRGLREALGLSTSHVFAQVYEYEVPERYR